MGKDTASRNETEASAPVENVEATILDVRTPSTNLDTRSNIVADGPGTVGEFLP